MILTYSYPVSVVKLNEETAGSRKIVWTCFSLLSIIIIPGNNTNPTKENSEIGKKKENY